MGCYWSSEGNLYQRSIAFEGTTPSYHFPTGTATYFGVGGFMYGGLCPDPTIMTPTIFYGGPASPTSAVCSTIDNNQDNQSIKCPVEVNKLVGPVTVSFLAQDPSGTLTPYGPRSITFSAFTGATPSGGTIPVTTEYSTFVHSTTYLNTVTTPAATCAGAKKAKLAKKAVCNADLVLRALSQNAASASTFCSTYTLSSAAPGYAYPKYLTSWSTTSTRISSACSCFAGAATTPPPTVNAPGCNADDPLRSLRVNSDQASTFCNTYTQTPATPGQSYPRYLTSFSTETARLSSACSCFKGLSPVTATTTTEYSGPTAMFAGERRVLVDTTTRITGYEGTEAATTVPGPCPT